LRDENIGIAGAFAEFEPISTEPSGPLRNTPDYHVLIRADLAWPVVLRINFQNDRESWTNPSGKVVKWVSWKIACRM
jgi:hypothetical protein